jgi:hypothetical protein
MKSTRKKNKFSNLSDLFQNLIDEKNRQRVESATINLTRQRAENESKRKNNKDEENKKDDSNEENDSKKNKCFKCDRSSHSKEKCSIVNSECIECHKIDH